MRYLRLFASVVLTLAIGGIAGIATADGVSGWYETLNKPSFNPPNMVFGPVWTLLYILMGISLWRIWELPVSIHRIRAIRIFFIQLTLNFAWSFIFFGMKEITLAFVEIVALWVCIFIMIKRFYFIDRKAALMNIPYLIWVTFATALNGAYMLLN